MLRAGARIAHAAPSAKRLDVCLASCSCYKVFCLDANDSCTCVEVESGNKDTLRNTASSMISAAIVTVKKLRDCSCTGKHNTVECRTL